MQKKELRELVTKIIEESLVQEGKIDGDEGDKLLDFLDTVKTFATKSKDGVKLLTTTGGIPRGKTSKLIKMINELYTQADGIAEYIEDNIDD